MPRFASSSRKYLHFSFCFLAPTIFAGCNSATPAEPALIPRQSAARQPAKTPAIALRPTPTPPDISKFATEFPAPKVDLPKLNGYDLLVRAAQSIQQGGEGSPDAMEKLSPEEDLKRQRSFTAKNARSLDLVQQGLQLPIMVPSARGLYATEPPYAKLRSLMRLMTQRNRVYAADKQWNEAINGALDIVQMGTELQNGGNAIGSLVATAIQSYGYKDMPQWVNKCDAQTALNAAKRMESLEKRMAEFSAVTPEAKWDGLVELQQLMMRDNWTKFRAGDPKSMGQFLRTPEAVKKTRTFSDSQIQRNYLDTMDKAIAQSQLPFSRKVKEIAPAADPFSDYLTSIYTSSGKINGLNRYVMTRTKNFALHRLLMTAFALQAFNKENGKFPQTLDELCGKYLPQVPRDPFAPELPLHYRPNGDNYVLYSVGPDAIDNGGAPIVNINIYEKTLDDIVFGYGVLRDGRE